MKNDQYDNSRTKYVLLQKKRKGVKRVFWRIDGKGKIEYIEEVLGFPVIPFLYEVETRIFKDVQNLPSVLKKLHYAKTEDGKKKKTMKLTKKEIEILEKYNIHRKAIKYEIILN